MHQHPPFTVYTLGVPDLSTFITGDPTEAAERAKASNEDGDIKRVSTKVWARGISYDSVKLFNKVNSPMFYTVCGFSISDMF